MFKIRSQVATAMVVLSSTLGLTACEWQNSIIKQVVFQPSENLETVRVSLQFTDKVQMDLYASFAIMDYGYLFLNAFTPTQPFEIGFDLNTDIVNEQDFLNIDPTTVLPNGLPIGLDFAIVQISGGQPISDKFDLYGYVDGYSQSLLGGATLFSFISTDYFPPGLSINQSFFYNDAGASAVMASLFGPTLDSSGNMIRAGGISLMANVRQLIEEIGADGATSDPLDPDGKRLKGLKGLKPGKKYYLTPSAPATVTDLETGRTGAEDSAKARRWLKNRPR